MRKGESKRTPELKQRTLRSQGSVYKVTLPGESRDYRHMPEKFLYIKGNSYVYVTGGISPLQGITRALDKANLKDIRWRPDTFDKITCTDVTSEVIGQLTNYFSSPEYKQQEQTMNRYLEEAENMVKKSGIALAKIYNIYAKEILKKAPI